MHIFPVAHRIKICMHPNTLHETTASTLKGYMEYVEWDNNITECAWYCFRKQKTKQCAGYSLFHVDRP